MGNEVQGAVRDSKNRYPGKILLETGELIFRSPTYRLKIAFTEMRSVRATDRELRVETQDGVNIFEVGAAARRWCEKILHPKTRAEKLGIKSAMRIRLAGESDQDFQQELRSCQAEILATGSSAAAQATFLFVNALPGLAKLAMHAKRLQDAEAIWVVYRKAQKQLTESQVIGAGRKAGLKDVKVVGFSATHTALKFVLPLAKR